MSLSLRISLFFFLGSLLTTAIWMPPDEFGDSGPTNVVAPPPDEPPLPAPADAAADTVVEDEEMVTSS